MIKKTKIITYVCSAVKENKLLSKMIEVDDGDAAYLEFKKEFGINPEIMFGPFFKKRTYVLEKNRDIKFIPNQTKSAIYNGWQVTAMLLENPPECAYIFYNKRIDSKSVNKPKINIVKISELKEI